MFCILENRFFTSIYMKTKSLINSFCINNLFELNNPFYYVLLIESKAQFSIDMIDYEIDQKSCVFLSPYQYFQMKNNSEQSVQILSFHGDFYCIEYHKKEVACNGILFNNIYDTPYILLNEEQFDEIARLFYKIKELQNQTESYEIALMKAYLQVILAICSKEKQLTLHQTNSQQYNEFSSFRELIEKHFLIEKSIAFYANHYSVSNEALSKKVKALYGKPPTVLIRERWVLEAKKQLHLTYKNINEIAFELGFDDEFYFSKYFKKEVGVSPKKYREQVGISIVAK